MFLFKGEFWNRYNVEKQHFLKLIYVLESNFIILFSIFFVLAKKFLKYGACL